MRRQRVAMAHFNNQVAEMQGLYGPFTIAERVVQKIWRQLDFDLSRAVLLDGRTLEVRSPGNWNLLGGPDFQAARLRIDGREVTGDVEVHFQVGDWSAHGHQNDNAYGAVVLHVVLFAPHEGARPALRRDGHELPVLALLPLLHRDLEEYASDDALEIITARAEWRQFAALAERPAADRATLLQHHAELRWKQKVHFARLRIAKLGWCAAAHHTALEVLGYRFNRAVMLGVAGRYPLAAWAEEVEPRRVFEERRVLWQLQGVRPANHPLTRLQQYQQWVSRQPAWPARLLEMAALLPAGLAAASATKDTRALAGFGEWRERFAEEVAGGVLGGTRLDNLICDGFLPLLTAHSGRDLAGLWFHWFAGDLPDQVRTALPRLGVTGSRLQPLCHGYGQGLLGWILERESRAGADRTENWPDA